MKEVAGPRSVEGYNKKLIPLRPVGQSISVVDERPQEECGLIAFIAPQGMTGAEARGIFAAAEGVQHRGQQGGGVDAVTMDGHRYVHKGYGLLKEALPEAVHDQVADMGVLRSVTIQARYGTHGGYEERNLQPLEARTADGTRISVSHNGNFADTQATLAETGQRYDFDVSDSRVWTDALASSLGRDKDNDIVDRVHAAVGAASLLINVGDETVYAARDRKGLRPLVLGTIEGELGPIHVVASETHALDIAHARMERDIRPGEIVKFDANGITVLEKGDKTAERMCSMEHAYMSSEHSRVNVTSNGESPERWPLHRNNRYEVGKQMGREERAKQIATRRRAERLGEQIEEFKPDVVVGIPSSGVPAGQGYAEELGIQYRELITRNEDMKLRTFQTDDAMAEIKAKVLKKLTVETPEGWDWKGKKVVFIDDSLVRGSVSSALTALVMQELGAEVHWRFAYPQIVNPCHLGVSIRTHEELIAYRQNGDVAAMAKEIGAKTVEFISPIGFIKSVQGDHYEDGNDPRDVFDRNRMCGGCITGDYPYSPEAPSIPRPTALAS